VSSTITLPPFDPERLPVSRRDHALPAVDAARLRPDWLRARLARPPRWEPETFRDVPDATGLRPASVLVPLVARAGGMQMLLTRRTSHLPVHAGQISFPGGRRDPGDRDAVHTALREAEEEIGLAATCIEPLGLMPDYTTITGYCVTPVVALVDPAATLHLQASEVAEAFEVPLDFLMNPAHHELRVWDGATGLPGATASRASRSFYAMPWNAGDGRSYFIWGATAAMIRNLYRLLIA
jgi:8-oxo-dGTP pyrophosphatase MutT (NUDIX family)